jgi:hypothetical protein
VLHIEEEADTGSIEEAPDPTDVNGGKKQSIFACLFVCSFVLLLVRSSVRSFVRSFVRLLVRLIEDTILYVCDTVPIYPFDFLLGTKSIWETLQ